MEENNYLCTQNQSSIEFNMDFNETFKHFGLNASQVAKQMGLAPSNLSRSIKNGTLDIRQLQQMADICGVSLGEFFGYVPKEITIKSNGQEYTYVLKK